MFERSSAEVASTLQLAIAHQDDLVLNVGAYVVANPNASQADVVHWSEAADHMDRFPEVLGFGFVVIVPPPSCRRSSRRRSPIRPAPRSRRIVRDLAAW